MLFLWIKSFHIIAVICWFAAMFYLPRLFVYHAEATDEISNERFKIMERKLYKGIMVPSMIATLIFGIWLAVLGWDTYATQGWFHLKVLLVVLLVGYHHMAAAFMKKFQADANTKSHKFYRWFNEVPVIILIATVLLVVIRPF